MAKLYYFNGRGKAELVRLTLAAAGVPFVEEFPSDRESFLKLIADGKLLFGQIPLLEIEGKRIVQTNAIVRYVGRKFGLMGKNLDEELLVDQYYEGSRDFYNTSMLPLGFVPEKEILDGQVKKSMSKYLPIFEKIAAANETGFLVGNGLTIADLSLVECLLVLVEYLGIDILKEYPALRKFYDVVTTVDRIAAFLKGPQRKKKNDERYVKNVCNCLGLELPELVLIFFGMTLK